MKILFLVPYPLGEAPSQRFRFEQYFKILFHRNISVTVQSFLNSQNWQTNYSNGNIIKKLNILTSGFARRFWVLTKVPASDFIFIHRETTPVGPPIIEWIIARIFKKKIIYDFDDAIWTTDKTDEGKVEKMMRWRSKVKSICKWAHKVSCGNEYLCDYARQFNHWVILNPTTIDTQFHAPDNHKKKDTEHITIGWTGSHSTLKYLNAIVPAILFLEQKYSQLRFLVIANQKPELNIKSLIFIPWSVSSEIEDLIKIDIGIMPLPDDEWSKGKCGFKLLQYMALGIVALASPVGVNTKIITERKNGFICANEQEWISNVEKLINDDKLRSFMGIQGRTLIDKHYSVSSNSANFLSLFD